MKLPRRYRTSEQVCKCIATYQTHLSRGGIQVTPNSSRVLRKLGIDKYIEKYCTEPIDLRMMKWRTGQILVEAPLKEPAEKEYGSPYWHIHRADLHRGLMEAATQAGCKIHLDSRVIKLDPSKPSLITKNGETFAGDLIVASDGMRRLGTARICANNVRTALDGP